MGKAGGAQGQRDAGIDRRTQAGKAGAAGGDAVAAAGSIEGRKCRFAKAAIGIEQRQRQFLFPHGKALLRTQPQHRFTEQPYFVIGRRLAHDNGQIELPGLQRLAKLGRTADAQFDPDARMAGREGAQQLRQAAISEILCRADGDATSGTRALERQPGLAVHGKNAAGMTNKILAGRRQPAPAPLRHQQRFADDLLQALHLRGHRRGRAADNRRSLSQRAAIDKGKEGFEQIGIQRLHTSIIQNLLFETIRFF
ncbi:hypothetical protein X748_27430 [Mesorhizobium sp. LNJC386A00]|nr:hypothetical protein X748_27430 [Mesorhizobium sp. LNJC386A00]